MHVIIVIANHARHCKNIIESELAQLAHSLVYSLTGKVVMSRNRQQKYLLMPVMAIGQSGNFLQKAIAYVNLDKTRTKSAQHEVLIVIAKKNPLIEIFMEIYIGWKEQEVNV